MHPVTPMHTYSPIRMLDRSIDFGIALSRTEAPLRAAPGRGGWDVSSSPIDKGSRRVAGPALPDPWVLRAGDYVQGEANES